MLKRSRIISVILAVAIAIGLVSSALFVVEKSEHKCSGVDCQICAQVNFSLKAFNNQTPRPETALSMVSVFWIMVLALGCKNNKVKIDTPINLKTKLSN